MMTFVNGTKRYGETLFQSSRLCFDERLYRDTGIKTEPLKEVLHNCRWKIEHIKKSKQWSKCGWEKVQRMLWEKVQRMLS